MKKYLASGLLALACTLSVGGALTVTAPTVYAASASPTVNDVEAAIARGDLQGAQTMLDQVVAAHPNSARAHYLDAQVLERNHRYADALDQIHAARAADPSIHFTDKIRFQTVERRIEAEAQRASAGGGNASVNPSAQAVQSNNLGMQQSAPVHHGPSAIAWIGLLVLIVAIVALIAWSMRRRREQDDQGADDMQRAQLKRATELLDAVRAAKLDLRLSASPDKAAWVADAEDVEGQLRNLIDSLSASGGGNRFASNSPASDPGYQLETLERRVARIKALAEGRPDPEARTEQSAYASEADRLSRQGYGANGPYNQPPAWQGGGQQPVIVQQQPSGLGAGLGGLAAGVLLGEAFGGGRERDVIVEHDAAPMPPQAPQSDQASPFDFGNGGNDWGDGGSQIDAGNDDNSWDDNS